MYTRCKCLTMVGVLGGILIFNSFAYAADGNEVAFKYVLDYDVPESPAFAMLDATPGTVLRASAAKPRVITLFNDLSQGVPLGKDLAVDFSPWLVFGGGLNSINDYRGNHWRNRILANTFISAATTQGDGGLVNGALAARVTWFDAHDLLMDDQLGADIDKALENAGNAPPPGNDTDASPVTVGPLGDAYKAARDRVAKKSGFAVSSAWGVRGAFRGGIVSRDSTTRARSRFWTSAGYSFGNSAQALGMVQEVQTDSLGWKTQAGIALRGAWSRWSVAGEVYYAPKLAPSASSKIGAGVNAEVRVLGGIDAITSISTVPDVVSGKQKLATRAYFRWSDAQ